MTLLKASDKNARSATVFLFLTLLISLFFLESGVVNVAASPTDWPMFHQNLAHTGLTSDVVTPPLNVAWSYTTGERVYSSPAVSGGIVYVGSADRNVYALDAVTGALKAGWPYTTGGPIRSSPAVSGGVVYVGSYDDKVYALDAATGAFVWSYPTSDQVYSSPAVSGTVVYVGSYDRKVYGFAPTSAQVATATGTGTATFTMSPSTAGGFTSLTASALSSVSPAPPAGLTFPDGLFSFTISGLASGATVTVTLTLPGPLPAGTFSYWKLQSGAWSQYPSASLDSTRTIITLTFTADASGRVTDPGGPAITTTTTSMAPIPVGGEMSNINLIQVVLPWLMVITALAVLSVWSLVRRRRR